mmetsp:Transcript_40192/g.65834  ORF Transcript_40192/g.65834 Transcript_40192/m.65834 type:complete len:99 (-) Transcript_40192:311-607(-)
MHHQAAVTFPKTMLLVGIKTKNRWQHCHLHALGAKREKRPVTESSLIVAGVSLWGTLLANTQHHMLILGAQQCHELSSKKLKDLRLWMPQSKIMQKNH